jgi:hypothetical protein
MERHIGINMYRFAAADPHNRLLTSGLALYKQPITNLFAPELLRDDFGSVNANPKRQR